jgi:antitoxin component of RelBE/YafQ-DinJ toxin-antitoxin module
MKDYPLGIRISEKLKDVMVIEADKMGLTLSAYVRLILIQKHN